ncbi:MAG: hypothetical protein LBN12_08515 [Clostridiales Family XIII bacterium]|jgi:hypothetical protein|nr:hypothetical protein [Clostridiales Family XIII bacterium]
MKFLLTLIIIFVAALAAFTLGGVTLNDGGAPGGKGTGTALSDLLSGVEDKKDEVQSEAVPYDWRLRHVHVIGDSLTVSAKKEIKEAIPGSSVDGKVSRGMAEGVKIYRSWVDDGLVEDDDIIVIALANNVGSGTIPSLDSVIEDIGPKQSLVLVTGHGKENMKPVNEYIRTLPDDFPFIVVADWDEAISANSSWLSGDGVHISNDKGNKLYADIIVDALEKTAPLS